MNWMKYFIEYAVCVFDFMILAAILIVIFGISHTVGSFCFVLILIYGTYDVWKKTGSFDHWKKEKRQQFYKNFEALCKGEKLTNTNNKE